MSLLRVDSWRKRQPASHHDVDELVRHHHDLLDRLAGNKILRPTILQGRLLDLLVSMQSDAVVPEAREHENACGPGAIAATLAACQAAGATQGLILEHTNMTMEQIEKYTDRDFYMTAEKARELGVVDMVTEMNQNKLKLLGTKVAPTLDNVPQPTLTSGS